MNNELLGTHPIQTPRDCFSIIPVKGRPGNASRISKDTGAERHRACTGGLFRGCKRIVERSDDYKDFTENVKPFEDIFATR
jgi:hypothetical protein